MGENIDTPFFLLWSCKGSSNCLYLDQAVLHVWCLPWLRRESWSKKKWPPSCHREPESPKSPKNIEDDVISCACAVHWLHMRSSWGHNPAHTTDIREKHNGRCIYGQGEVVYTVEEVVYTVEEVVYTVDSNKTKHNYNFPVWVNCQFIVNKFLQIYM